ncbi:type I polyketide synthase [Aliiroseovarius sp. F47248L]|uniref:type I polyketide synthase n=1 Tax=Aliiroseovarius sp. F47248L TaxID=2926420 RepID=UPI001FF6933C|nr:type I polyketide synthase [Aliiroseovarius sp. F47248L]MCK0140583.1 SDR family NAD(P)-dependent oxidoreductase [Aliiroseovarius sp. F47248L]
MTAGNTHNRIAIIGRAGRFSSAPTVRDYWRLLADGRSGETRLSDADLLAAGVPRTTLADPGYVKVAHVFPDMECFDAGFFGFSPKEASIMDPQHRHFLETSWEALEDAGHMPENFDGRIGVYAGSGMQTYMPYNLLSNPELLDEIGYFLLRHTGNDKDFLTTRLSYLLNLTGPSVAVQTACSTSLVAVHMAANSLLNMECDMALAGGVTIELPHRVGYGFSPGEILSPDGLCRTFDDDSQGTVFGSGAAMVVLRRYDDAVEDGDDIKAVILASAINNDGSGKASYLAPSVDGQAEAAAEAVALAGVDPSSISYIETHGTGTPIGDPIELSALDQVYGDALKGSIGIGSVKTNIGHTDTAAGTASLIKVVEALRHKYLPASLNFTTPNKRFDFDSSPFQVVAKGRDWNRGEAPLRAAVNSLGVGGTNAHVVVEEAPPRAATAGDGNWQLFPFSARTDASLEAGRTVWADFLSDAPSANDIAYTLREGRRAFGERSVVAARSADELAAVLDQANSVLARRAKATDEPTQIVFLFPGGGAQYPGAGAGMLTQSKVFADAVNACFADLPDTAPNDLYRVMFECTLDDTEARRKLGQSGYAIPALFILEYAYAAVWKGWGITPDAILAHSVGEYAGAVVAGAMTLRDALAVVTLRGQVMDAAPTGAMTTVPFPEDETRAILPDSLDIAAINTAETTVVSGTLSEIEAFEKKLARDGIEARRIHIDVAAHSRQLDGQLDQFRSGFEGVHFTALNVPMVSSMRGDWAQGEDLISADYWVRHLRNTVRFTDAVSAALDTPNRIVIEVGPGQTLGPLVEAAVSDHPAAAILPSAPAVTDTTDEYGAALAAFGGLWAAGHEIDWSKAVATAGQRVSLPTYAFEKQRHWIEPGKGVGDRAEDDVLTIPRIEDIDMWFEKLEWQTAPRTGLAPDLSGPWLVFANDDVLSEMVLRELGTAGAQVIRVMQGDAFATIDGGYTLRPDCAEDYDQLGQAMGEVPPRILSLWSLAGGKSFENAYDLARMLQQTEVPPGARLGIATCNITALADPSATAPENAALLGVTRSAPREVPGLAAVLVDLLQDGVNCAAQLLAEVAGSGADDLVALRDGGKRLVRRRVLAPAPSPNTTELPKRLRRGGTYLITGGTGGIGRQMALWLAQTVGANVALLSRSAQPDPMFEAKITAAGGALLMVAADVTDEAALSDAINKIRARFGDLNGVIHAAGLLDDAPLAARSAADAASVMAPKLLGGELLNRLLPSGTLDVFATISSTSVEVGPPGQVAYVGGNAAVDALAASRPDGLSIAWGTWRDSGMAARAYGHEMIGDDKGILGQRHEGEGKSVVFQRVLDPEQNWELSEHVVAGHPVLPGTAYIELAHEAARQVLNGKPYEINALSLAQPMVFSEGLPRVMQISLRPVLDGYDLTVESRLGSDAQMTDHAQMRIRIVRAQDQSLPEDLVRTAELLPIARDTRSTQEDLIGFGPRWDSVTDTRRNADVIEGHFQLPDTFADDLVIHPLHPALLDMAATFGLGLLELSADHSIYAPMSADRVRVFAPLPDRVISRARKVAETPGSFVAFDVLITSEDGAPLMVIEHLALRAIDRAQLSVAPKAARLTDQLLATGIRDHEAPAVFARAFTHPAKHLVVSPTSLDLVALAMAEANKPAKAGEKRSGSGGRIADPVAAKLAGIWAEILGVDGIGLDDDFFDLGGHSLSAVRMFGRIRKEYEVSLPLATLFEAPSVATLAALVRDKAGIEAVEGTAPDTSDAQRKPSTKSWSPLVVITKGSEYVRPFYCIHGAGGNILNFRPLAGFLDPSIPFVGLRALGSDGGSEVDETIEAMAERYIRAMRDYQPIGPYRLSGYSGGGVVAYEMMRQLRAAGDEVETLVYFDTIAPHMSHKPLSLVQKLWAARKWDIEFALGWRERRQGRDQDRRNAELIRQHLAAGDRLPDELIGQRMTDAFVDAQTRYETPSQDATVTLFKARKAGTLFIAAGPNLGWDRYIDGPIDIREFDCDHFTMMTEPAIIQIGDVLNKLLLRKE